MLMRFVGWLLGLIFKNDPLYDEEMGYIPRDWWEDDAEDDTQS